MGKTGWFWSAVLCAAGWACSRSSAHTVVPVKEPPRPDGQSTWDGGASKISTSPRPSQSSECKEALDKGFDPRALISEDVNESLGLVCFGKDARYFCPRDDGPACRDRVRVLVDESGEPLEQQFRGGRLCSSRQLLYGCNRKGGGEVIPFIHVHPIEFTASGFALVGEEYREDRQQGGYFYVDSRYEQKFEALTLDGIPEPWLPLNVVRYRKDGKIGFLDLRSGIVTPPFFNSAFSFNGGKGRTLVCEDCHPERWGVCPPPEAQCSGTAYLIDEQGKRLKEKPSEDYKEYWWCKRRPGKRLEDSACQ